LDPATKIVRCPTGADDECQKSPDRPKCASSGEGTVCRKWAGTGVYLCSFAASTEPQTSCACYATQVRLCNKSGSQGLPGAVGYQNCIAASDTQSSWGGCTSLPATAAPGGGGGTGNVAGALGVAGAT
jgi:hypothetical protein